MKRWVRDQWLRAQGVPRCIIFEGAWKDPGLFRASPPRCFVCGRAWRPDLPRYVSVWGRVHPGPQSWLEWSVPGLGIYGMPTGNAQDHYRSMCVEHGDRWESAPDCFTGEDIKLSLPPSRIQRALRDVRYWTGTALRFAFLIGQWTWLWVAYKVAGYAPLYVWGPWPPLRESS